MTPPAPEPEDVVTPPYVPGWPTLPPVIPPPVVVIPPVEPPCDEDNPDDECDPEEPPVDAPEPELPLILLAGGLIYWASRKKAQPAA